MPNEYPRRFYIILWLLREELLPAFLYKGSMENLAALAVLITGIPGVRMRAVPGNQPF